MEVTIVNNPEYDLDLGIHLATIAQMLALVTTEQVRQHVAACRSSIDRADTLGSILDPTAYREALHDGSLQDAKNQLAIVEALLKARELIDKREAFVASMEAKKAARKKP